MRVSIEVSVVWAGAISALSISIFAAIIGIQWPSVDWLGALDVATLPIDLWVMWQVAKIMVKIWRVA